MDISIIKVIALAKIIKPVFILLTLCFSYSDTFAQLTFLPNDITKAKESLPDKIKKIVQYKDSLLINVREYDTLKNLIFSHYKQSVDGNWDRAYLTMISGWVYNSSGRVLKTYHLHSNIGVSIWYNEYDDRGNIIKVQEKVSYFEKGANITDSNSSYFIRTISNFDELFHHPKIKEVENKKEKTLIWERQYDSLGNMVSEISFKSNGDTSGIKRHEYDNFSNRVYSYYKWSEKMHWEYFFEHKINQKVAPKDNKSDPNKPHSKLVQSVRVDYDWRQDRKRMTDIIYYKYDNHDRLIEKLEHNKGVFESKYIYSYNKLGQVTKRVSYVYDPDKVAVIQSYIYNKEGDVVKETDQDFRDGEKIVNKYQYVYEYYK